jgi:dihydrofolate reductase
LTDEEGFAEGMNSIPERNATVIRDVAGEIPKLKKRHDLLVMGSGPLANTLREHDLVDEYEIWIHPIAPTLTKAEAHA